MKNKKNTTKNLTAAPMGRQAFSTPREAAAEALLQILEKDRMSHLIMRETLSEQTEWDARDRAFFTRLLEGTLEHLCFLDGELDSLSKTPVRKMKPFIRQTLRVAAFQILFLDGVPVSAACNEAVKLAGKRGFTGLKGFVNGVLRSLIRKKEEGGISFQPGESLKERSRFYSVPEWLILHLEKSIGKEKTEQVLKALEGEQEQCVHVHLSRAGLSEVRESLEKEGILCGPSPYFPEEALRVKGSLTGTAAFREGLIQPQDESSMLAIASAGIKPGMKILDVCAAPGGKSMFAAERTGEKGFVESRDLTEEKVRMIRENAARCRFPQVKARVFDALVPEEGSREAFDLVIADLPCSGLGIAGRKKDIRYKMTEEQMGELAELQKRMLDVVREYVRCGGRLLFSTCTINPAENEENRAYLLQDPRFLPVDLSGEAHLASLTEKSLKEGYLQLLPGVHRCDGFFFSVFERREEP